MARREPGLTARRRWIVAAVLLAVAGTTLWCALSAQRAGRVGVRFLGYAFEAPRMSFDLASNRSNPAGHGARVARFLVTNGCDFAIHCSLSVRYTNGMGAFFPREISLEAHAATNIVGLANAPLLAGTNPSFSKIQAWFSRAPSWTDWTNSWRLTVAYRKSPPLRGIEGMRYRTAMWLIQRKLHRMARVLNPVEIHTTETDLIPPDVPARRDLD